MLENGVCSEYVACLGSPPHSTAKNRSSQQQPAAAAQQCPVDRVVSCGYHSMIRGLFVAQLLVGFLGTFAWAIPSSVPSSAPNKPTTPLFDDHGETDSPMLSRLVTPISGQISFKTKTRNGVRGKWRVEMPQSNACTASEVGWTFCCDRKGESGHHVCSGPPPQQALSLLQVCGSCNPPGVQGTRRLNARSRVATYAFSTYPISTDQ